MAPDKNKILQQKIADLNFTADFKSTAAKLGFVTVEDITQLHVATLLELEGFTYHMLQEFIQHMQQNNLSQLIKQH